MSSPFDVLILIMSETNNAGNGLPDSQRMEVLASEIQPVPPTDKPKASQEGIEIVPFDELVAEPDQRRSRIRVFAIMTALFVSAIERSISP